MSPTISLELVLVLLKLNIANVTPSVKVNTPIITLDKNIILFFWFIIYPPSINQKKT